MNLLFVRVSVYLNIKFFLRKSLFAEGIILNFRYFLNFLFMRALIRKEAKGEDNF